MYAKFQNTQRPFFNINAIFKLIFIGSFLAASASAATFSREERAMMLGNGFELVYQDGKTNILDQDYVTVTRFLEEVSAKLPPLLKGHLNRVIKVRFKDFYESNSVDDSEVRDFPSEAKLRQAQQKGILMRDPDRSVSGRLWPRLGSYSKGLFQSRFEIVEINLNKQFLPIILAGESAARSCHCNHGNVYRLAQATVIHQLFLIYDESLDSRLSRQNMFEKLTDWRNGFFGRWQKNELRTQSPDAYEFAAPRRSLAVNGEYYVLDPEFKCRRPAINEYFDHWFRNPYPERNCEQNNWIFVSDTFEMVNIDPERVYAIDYLYGGEGSSIASRWGHAMIRLVICAEGRPLGPDCRTKDSKWDIVISYRANVDDLITSNWKGFFGGYNSMIFIFKYSTIQTEYTIAESRQIESIPIPALNDPYRKRLLLSKIREHYWSYMGRYWLLFNNCAHETRDLLQAGLGDVPGFGDESPISPNGLRELLKSSGVGDFNVFNDDQLATQKGYMIKSRVEITREHTFRVMQRWGRYAGIHPDDLDPEWYYDESTPQERRKIFNKMVLGISPADSDRIDDAERAIDLHKKDIRDLERSGGSEEQIAFHQEWVEKLEAKKQKIIDDSAATAPIKNPDVIASLSAAFQSVENAIYVKTESEISEDAIEALYEIIESKSEMKALAESSDEKEREFYNSLVAIKNMRKDFTTWGYLIVNARYGVPMMSADPAKNELLPQGEYIDIDDPEFRPSTNPDLKPQTIHRLLAERDYHLMKLVKWQHQSYPERAAGLKYSRRSSTHFATAAARRIVQLEKGQAEGE